MKGYKPCANTLDATLEQIEQIIECIEPCAIVRVEDVTAKAQMAKPNTTIINAIKMMLKKYGIECLEKEDDHGRQDALEEDRV